MAHNRTELRVSEVAELLFKGKSRKEIIEFCKKAYKVKTAGVDRYIGLAKPIVSELNARVAKKLEEKQVEVIAEEHGANVLSYVRKREILAEIANKKKKTTTFFKSINGEMVVDTAITSDMSIEAVKAIEADNRMTGDNAPEKHEIKKLQIVVMSEKDRERLDKL